MTYNADDSVVPELKLQKEDRNGDYLGLLCSDGHEVEEFGGVEPPSPKKGKSVGWWVKMVLFCICLGALAIVGIIWVGPIIMEKVFIHRSSPISWFDVQFTFC